MRNLFTTSFLIFAFVQMHSFGQMNQIVVAGKVIDKTTQEALPYATISIKGESIGVVSNASGEFIFKFSNQYLKDTLTVSMMGYETHKRIISSIDNPDNLLVKLAVKTIMLSEVVIISKEMIPKEIIEKTICNIKLNYPQQPYLMNGFYRDYKKENEKYIALLEAAVSIYDKGYAALSTKQKAQLQEHVFINEIRKSKTVNYQAKIYTNLNLLDELLRTNDVHYLRRALDAKANNYELEKYIYIDEQLVYVIKTDPPWSSLIFIDAENFAVLKIEMDARWEGSNKNEWQMKGSDSIMNRTPFIKKTIKFKKYEGKYFLEYMNYSWRIEGFKKGSDKILFTSDFYQELLVNNINTTNPIKPSQKKLMSATKILEHQTQPYNEAFWQNYNIIRESPLNKQIIRDLEEAGTLEDRFKKSNQEKSSKRVKKN